MRLLIYICHPAQAYFFNQVILGLKERGHDIKIVVRAKECTLEILDYYHLDYELISIGARNGLFRKAIGLIEMNLTLIKIVKSYRPDLLLSETSYISQVGKILHIPSILICQNEHANLENFLFLPFADTIITFKSFYGKQNWTNCKVIDGYFFLPYLHSEYFHPDPTVLTDLKLKNEDKIAVIRFSSWEAAHDHGQKGFSIEEKLLLIHELEKDFKVYIISEGDTPDSLEKYILKVSAVKFHSLLHYATICISEGGSTAAESAILGTPTIYFSTIKPGYICELRDKYGLIESTSDINQCMKFIEIIRGNPNIKDENSKKKNLMITENKDVVKHVIEIVESYKAK